MAIELKLNSKTKEVRAVSAEDFESLHKSFYGTAEKGQIILDPVEALYLMDVRNAGCIDEKEKQYSFNSLASLFMKPKLLANYLTYKDWRERGLIIKDMRFIEGRYKKNPVVRYPSTEFTPPAFLTEGLFFTDDRSAVVDESDAGKRIYLSDWFGQFGSYKAEERGRLLKLDQFETYFLMNHSGFKVKEMDKSKLYATLSEDPDFEAMYTVYEDWRLRGFVLKTGFKFGTHFRIYFPGAAPSKKGEWIHSKHVIHVFPRTKRLIIAEWARAIRVAHSVRKTFILAIPGKRQKPKMSLDFLLYHRKPGKLGGIETPKDEPSFAMLSLSEDEMIGGAELADAIEAAKEMGLDLMLSIADRETAVTHYHVKRIELPGSKYEYFEIEWAQP